LRSDEQGADNRGIGLSPGWQSTLAKENLHKLRIVKLPGFDLTPMSCTPPAASHSFSLSTARHLVHDCFRVRPWIYWCDFLASYGLGVFCYHRVRGGSMLHPHQGITGEWSQVLFFIASCLLFYRAALFIHELVHQRNGSLAVFRIVWNLICGIPLLIPSFVYYTHIDHHRRAHYGTHADGEYLPLVHRRPSYVLYYLSWSLIIPALVVVRFMFLAPLAWISPAARRWIHRHASPMVMDPSYIRPLPTSRALRNMRLQELGCFLWCWGIAMVPPVVFHRWPLPFVVHAYATAVVVVMLNAIRTLAAHHWRNTGEQMSFVDQLTDSVNYPNWPWINEMWAPLGLRYHALHHLFPSMPYHSLPRAHRLLMQHLPADSPYRLTNSPSLLATLRTLLRESSAAHRSDPIPVVPDAAAHSTSTTYFGRPKRTANESLKSRP
jgi:fatty acid desaturase